MALLQNVIGRGTHASRPAAGSAGLLWFETDTGQFFRDSGSAWQLIDLSTLFATKGDLLVGTGSGTVAKLAAGTDTYVLTADSAQTDGIKWAAAATSSATIPHLCCGRLSLTSGTAVTTSDVTAATTVYFTPYQGAQVSTYSGSAWTTQAFTEQSLSLSGLTADTNYDVFMVDSTLVLEGVAWTNATTRATALVLQDGIYVKSGATTRRYLGTIRITGTTGQCEDSATKRYVWNARHRKARPLLITDTTDNWSYGTATWRQARATAGNKVEYVCGLSEDPVHADVRADANLASGIKGFVGVGVDSTSANSAQQVTEFYYNGSGSASATITARYDGWPGIGYHYLAWIEYASGASATFLGDDGTVMQSGLRALVLA